jgi:hypothetical protein
VDAKIVSAIAQEFDINSFEAMETEAMNALSEHANETESIKVTMYSKHHIRLYTSDFLFQRHSR